MTNYMVDVDALVHKTIQDCIDDSYIVTSKDKSYETMYYQIGLQNPEARVMCNPHRPLNPVVAVARFVWMMAANNRVEDIAFYEPKVRNFSDDGITVPGSNYGLRLLQPRPGLNQIKGVIDRLRSNQLSRQASAVVWQPEDAVRNSSDIPCTFGVFFHVRNEKLDMCVNMRSNNAFRILPFNVFEFTMLQEVVANELKLEMGRYTHWAASMHVYDNPFELPATLSIVNDIPGKSIFMETMPTEVSALQQIQIISKYEAQMRHATNLDEVLDVWDKACCELTPYWRRLFAILLSWALAKFGNTSFAFHLVPQDLRKAVEGACNKLHNNEIG